MRHIATLVAVSAVLSGCTLADLGSGVNRRAVSAASTPQELVDMGAVRLDEAGIMADMSGRTFVEPNQAWVWQINADGTQGARAGDGEWEDGPGGRWQVVDNKFCRENDDLALKCSDIYKIGPYYRFTEPDGNLALWTITPG